MDTKSDLLLTYSSKKDKLKFTDSTPNLFFNVYVDSNDYLHFITNRNEQMIFDEKRRVFSLRKEVKDSFFSFVDRESDKEIKIPFLAQKIQDSSDDHEFIEYTKVNTRHKPIQLKRSAIKNRSEMDYNGKILYKK
ncbi:hypothetical protein TUBRATIS_004930 [Tubulinosema ratisbonensis]|uniref:Uncharacterized protein n=1 Tax=Tubulinosema ratisbonensis TaxID=291195 RepID=A0A437APP2_9MICR|nr:hypothetical protein TUBRATIS_004930 [Tubulinosema ratisbonensis]